MLDFVSCAASLVLLRNEIAKLVSTSEEAGDVASYGTAELKKVLS